MGTLNSRLNSIESVLDWLDQGETVWLTTITKTWGSSPMPAGTSMVYCETYGVVGGLSGGCIEEELIEQIKSGALLSQITSQNRPLEIVFGLTEQQQQRLQLPCGGTMHLLVERLLPEAHTLAHFNELQQALSERQLIARRIPRSSQPFEIVRSDLKRGITETEHYFQHGLGPNYQMLLIGASEVARCVAQLAQPLDFNVFVWDYREEFTRNWQVDNVDLFNGSPEKLIRQNFNDQHNAIIALAHDPRLDDIALLDALSTEAFYIGAIGSQKTCSNRRSRLLSYLDDPSSLDKLIAPVGIRIGSKTPYEIAISVLAQVIEKRSELEKSFV